MGKKKARHAPSQGGSLWQKPKKSLGQNFILDEGLLESLYALTGIGDGALALEIGAGLGTLTKVLAKHCREVITIELDHTLVPLLRVMFEKQPVRVVEGDALKIDLGELTAQWDRFHVVANIPYYLTTDLVTRLLFSRLPIDTMNLMVQKEAAQRLTAGIGEEGYCLLSLQCAYFGTARILQEVGKECFDPVPKVDSAFVSMTFGTPKYRDDAALEKRFFKIITAAFAMRRKTLQNNLMNAFSLSREEAGAWLESAGIDSMARGETVPLEAFYRLTECGA